MKTFVKTVPQRKKSQISFEIDADAFSIGSSAALSVDAPSRDSSSLDEEIRKQATPSKKKEEDDG